MSLNTLILSDDNLWSNKLKTYLDDVSVPCLAVEKGKYFQMELTKSKYFACLIDANTDEMNTKEILQFIHQKSPSLKVIFIYPDEETFEKKQKEYESFQDVFKSTTLTKTIHNKEILSHIEGLSLYSNSPNKQKTDEEKFDDLYTAIPIEEIIMGKSALFDLYLKISENKFSKVLEKGQAFDKSYLIEMAEERGVGLLYFKTEDRHLYISMMNKVIEISTKKSVSSTVKLTNLKNVGEKIYEELTSSGVKSEMIDESYAYCSYLHNTLRNDKDFSLLL